MAMSKKHYEAFAKMCRELHPGFRREDENDLYTAGYEDGAVGQWRATCQAIAVQCKLDNPRFDRERFLTACVPPKLLSR